MSGTSAIGLLFALLFLILVLVFLRLGQGRQKHYLRDIPAFSRFKRQIGLAVESGKRLHVSLGHGGVSDVRGGSGLVGLSLLQRIARAASVSDRPPVATSGEATLAVLSQDTLRTEYRAIHADAQYDPDSGQLTGVTPFSFAAGVLPVIYDQQVAANLIAGHFGSEVALLTDAAERTGSLTLAGSDNPQAQAILYASAQEPLIGEELYAAGAYLQVNPAHLASVRAQDILRWIVVVVILVGSVLKFIGIF
jgi:hypothetical protein